MPFPATLKNRLRQGRVIPVVGAGVSMAVHKKDGKPLFPSWKDLLLAGALSVGRAENKAKPSHDESPRFAIHLPGLRSTTSGA